MSDYYIPDHVHFAFENDTVVFMNLRTDQYSMLVGDKACAFSALVSCTADSIQRVICLDNSIQDNEPKALHDDLIKDLLTHGLLTRDSSDSTGLIPALIRLPEENLLEPQRRQRSQHIGVGALWTFLVSCLISRWRLSFTSIEHTVHAIGRRKCLHEGGNTFDVNEARRLVCLYNRLRPLAPHDYVCLFDSLSLLEFLARNDCYPNWLFAVQLEPWAAHCWVQYGTIAFNEDAALARTYLPLMVI